MSKLQKVIKLNSISFYKILKHRTVLNIISFDFNVKWQR